MPSKKITIKRIFNSVPSNINTDDAKVEEYMSYTFHFQASRNTSAHNTKPYNGLGFVGKDKPYDKELEEKVSRLIPPDLIEYDYDKDRPFEFKKNRDKFYSALSKEVPFDGLVLEIGLTLDNAKPIGVYKVKSKIQTPEGEKEVEEEIKNLPIEPMDYVIWKALFENQMNVAESKEEAEMIHYKDLYIFDKDYETIKKLEKEQLYAKAFALFSEIQDKDVILKRILFLIDKPLDSDPNINKLTVNEYCKERPKEFIEIATDTNFDNKVLLKQFVKYNVVLISQEAYLDYETTEEIAPNLKAMLEWMKDNNNISIIARYKDAVRAKLQSLK